MRPLENGPEASEEHGVYEEPGQVRLAPETADRPGVLEALGPQHLRHDD